MTESSHTRTTFAGVEMRDAVAVTWLITLGAIGLSVFSALNLEMPLKLFCVGFCAFWLGVGIVGFLSMCGEFERENTLLPFVPIIVALFGAIAFVIGLVGLLIAHVHVSFS